MFEEFSLLGHGKNRKYLLLKFASERLQAGVHGAALVFECDQIAAGVIGVWTALNQANFLHASQDGGDSVGVAGHQVGQRTLGEALRMFVEPAQYRKLVGGDSGVGNVPTKSLIESIPRSAQKRSQS